MTFGDSEFTPEAGVCDFPLDDATREEFAQYEKEFGSFVSSNEGVLSAEESGLLDRLVEELRSNQSDSLGETCSKVLSLFANLVWGVNNAAPGCENAMPTDHKTWSWIYKSIEGSVGFLNLIRASADKKTESNFEVLVASDKRFIQAGLYISDSLDREGLHYLLQVEEVAGACLVKAHSGGSGLNLEAQLTGSLSQLNWSRDKSCILPLSPVEGRDSLTYSWFSMKAMENIGAAVKKTVVRDRESSPCQEADTAHVRLCAACQHSNNESAKYCKQCGSPLSVVANSPTCDHCGGLVSREAKFCKHCGEKLTRGQEISEV